MSSFFSSWPAPYLELAEAIAELRRRFDDRLLLAASIVHPRHAIPNEHSRLLSDIKEQKPFRLPSLVQLAKSWIGCFISALYDATLALALKIRFGGRAAAWNNMKPDTVMKTWVPSPAALSKPDDFYYGSLPEALKARGVKPLMLVGDGRSDDGSWVAKLKSGFRTWDFVRTALASPQRPFPEALLVPVGSTLAAPFKQLWLSLRLRRFAAQTEAPVLKRLAAQASLDVLRAYTTKNETHFFIAKAAVRRWKPRAVATFFEGQPWEKLFWLGAKRADPRVSVIGYQHTVILPHSLALLKPFARTGEVAVPDVVMCTGQATKEMLDPVLTPLNSKAVVIGSHRRPPQAAESASPRPQKKTILVMPEGILTEAIRMFDFAMEAAAQLPDHLFVFRNHPVLPFEKVEPHLKRKAADFSNIEVSRRSAIQEDFDRSSALLYRGSSSVFYAVLAGLKPFYGGHEEEPVVDPLFGLAVWREKAGDLQALIGRLKSFENAGLETLLSDWQTAKRYVDQLVQPLACLEEPFILRNTVPSPNL